jgi:hypothetical protein
MGAEAQTGTRNWIIATVVVLLVVIVLVIALTRKPTEDAAATAVVTPEEATAETVELTESAPVAPPSAAEQARLRWAERFGVDAEWPRDLNTPRDCERVERDLQSLCAYIDARPGVREMTQGYASCDLLRDAADVLANRPPRITSELVSYETILSNVFHLFRVLGRQHLRLPGKLLRDEPDLAEPLALAAYRWTISRDGCVESTPIDADVLYDYAGFLFNTMGGQAYLRRRPPLVEGLTCFYALQIVDAAQERGHNPAGLDPRNEIQRCRDLLATQPLVFTSDYLANLEDMALRWDAE